MCVIVLVKELLTTKKKWFVLTEYRCNKESINKWSEFIGRRHGKSKSSEIQRFYFQHNFGWRGRFSHHWWNLLTRTGCPSHFHLWDFGWRGKRRRHWRDELSFCVPCVRHRWELSRFSPSWLDLSWHSRHSFRFCWYSAIASGLPRNVGNASFGFFVVVNGSTGALVSNTLVLIFIARISSSILWFASATKYKSVGNDSDSGWGGVDNSGYMLQDVADLDIGRISRLLKIKLKIYISGALFKIWLIYVISPFWRPSANKHVTS